MLTEEVIQDRSKRFAARLIEYTNQKTDQMLERVRQYRPVPYYHYEHVQAVAQRAKHEGIMRSSKRPASIMSFGEWKLSAKNKEGM